MTGKTKSRLARPLAALAVAVVLGVLGAQATASNGSKPPTLEFLGQAIVPTGTTFAATTVGGLSSIAYDADRGVFYVLSDDPSQLQAARFYTLRLAIADGLLSTGDVQFQDVTTLQGPNGLPFPPLSLDPEGLTLTKDGELVITSEGFANSQIPPWVRTFDLDGAMTGELAVPDAFLPVPGTRGVRQNLGVRGRGRRAERPVPVRGYGRRPRTGRAAGHGGSGSPVRILRYNLQKERLDRQYVYWTDPVAEPPVPPTNFAVNGLVELLPFNNEFMLSMERSFSVGAPDTGNTIKLYSVALPGADDVNGVESLAGTLGLIDPAQKTLLLDLDTLGIPLDNVEGMTLGPRLPDGRRSLILVSDNNFAASQFTQFLLFALS